MLTLIDVALKSFAQQLQAAKAGKLAPDACWRDLHRSIGRLHDKIDLSEPMGQSFREFDESAKKLIAEIEINTASRKTARAYATTISQLTKLQQQLELWHPA